MRVKYPPSRQKQNVFLGLIMLFVLGHFMVSCSKYKDDLDFDKLVLPGWNPEFAMPLVNTTYSLMDILGDENIEFVEIDDDGLVSLVYSSQNLVSAKAEEYITINDQEFNFTVPVNLSSNGLADTIFNQYEFVFNLTPPDQRIDSAFLKSGVMNVRGETNLNKDESVLQILLPELLHDSDNTPLYLEIPLDNPGGGQSVVTFDEFIDLSQFKLVFNADGNGVENQLNMITNLIVQPDDQPNMSPYSLNFNGDLKNMKFHQMYGYFGNHTISFSDSIRIRIFENSIGGGVNTGPDALNFQVRINNSIGVPVNFNANMFKVYSPVNSPHYEDIYLFGEGIANTFDIQSPNIDQIGQSIPTILDFSQTNFPDVFLSLAPRKLYYDFTATLNPDADPSNQNFVLDTSRVSFGASLEFELFSAIEMLSFIDTLRFNLNSSDESFDYLIFRFNAVNGFPIDALFQIYFADASYNLVDSLIYDTDERIIAGASVGLPPKLRVIKPESKMTDIKIDNTWLENVKNAKFMFLKAGLRTTNGELMKIYNDYELNFKIGISAGLNITSDN